MAFLAGLNPCPFLGLVFPRARAYTVAQPIGSPCGDQSPSGEEELNAGAVIGGADTIPCVREKIVLRAVIEFVTRTQLATDVETQSGNSDSK